MGGPDYTEATQLLPDPYRSNAMNTQSTWSNAAERERVDEPLYSLGRVLAILPAYNEQDSIAAVAAETKRYVDKVVVIDDASTDDSAELARATADGVVSHPCNLGVGGAVHTGYQVGLRESFDVVVQLDADGQHDPADIPRLLARMEATGADMVIGSRWLNDSHEEYSALRRAGIRFFTWEVNALSDLDITDVTSGFRAYRTDLLADLQRPEDSHWAIEQTLEASRKGYSIVEVSTEMPPNTDGSQFDLATFLKYPPRMLTTTLKVLLFR